MEFLRSVWQQRRKIEDLVSRAHFVKEKKIIRTTSKKYHFKCVLHVQYDCFSSFHQSYQ